MRTLSALLGVVVLAASVFIQVAARQAIAADPAGGKTPIKYARSEIPAFKIPPYKGKHYQARIPDTLELQDRAALCINCLTEVTDPDYDYEVYWFIFFTYKPAFMRHEFANLAVQVKFMEALPLLRMISGSGQNPHVERRWMEVLLHQLGPDGLAYTPLVGRPWCRDNLIDGIRVSEKGDQTLVPFRNGRALSAMTLFAQRDPAGPWRDTLRPMVDGLNKLVVHDGDQAWFWPQAFYAEYDPPADAKMPMHNMDNEIRTVPHGLVHAYRYTGYRPALELAGKVNRYLRRTFFLPDGTFVYNRENLSGRAHFHAHTASLLAMLEYGLEADDRDLLDFVVKSYNYAKTQGETLTGYFPEFIRTEGYHTSELCEVADMIGLALKLSQSGVEDCWDDADRWIRNIFAEGQLIHIDWIRRMPDSLAEQYDHNPIFKPDPVKNTADRVAERNRGGFSSWPSMNEWYTGRHGPGIMHCCTANAARTLYWIWDAILTHKDDKLKVNLLLNRASPWADVNSHVPYTGQVDVKIKQPVDLAVRIPEWVKPEEVTCTVNGATRRATWDGRYAGFGRVESGDTATMKFPIFEREDVVEVMKKKYALVRKGNTVVVIDPPGRYAPMYERRYYRVEQTRWRTIDRFLSPEVLPW